MNVQHELAIKKYGVVYVCNKTDAVYAHLVIWQYQVVYLQHFVYCFDLLCA